MPKEWEDFSATCPACEGSGCEICADRGTLVVPSKVRGYITEIQGDLVRMRKVRRSMLTIYLRWMSADEDRRSELLGMLNKENLDKDGITDDLEGHRKMDRVMTLDILDIEDQIGHTRKMVEKGEVIVKSAKQIWKEAKQAVEQRVAKPPPPPIPKREEKHEPCSFPGCNKEPKVWGEDGRGWCRKHGYHEGLLGGEVMEEPKKKERWPDELRGG